MRLLYDDFYLKCNVLLLAYKFEKFRNNSLKNKGLCPSHYLSAQALSWDAMLKMTKINFKLNPDSDMFIFSKKDWRIWISCISNRYSKSNKYLKSYDPKHESKHIIKLDNMSCNV